MSSDGRPGGRALGALILDARLSVLVGKAHNAIGIGHVELVADERHAEGLAQAFEKHRLHVGNPVAVCVAQQSYAIGVLGNGTCATLNPGLCHGPWRPGFAGLRRGFRYKNITIGQHIKPARMLQVAREGIYLQTRCHLGVLSLGQGRTAAHLMVGNSPGFDGSTTCGDDP